MKKMMFLNRFPQNRGGEESFKMSRVFKVFLFALFFQPVVANALNNGEHAGYMWRILPFDENQSSGQNAKVSDLYSMINDYLDKPDGEMTAGYPCFIYQKPYYKTLHIPNYNHRIWFHWGFNASPRKYEPLLGAIDIQIEENRMSEANADEFWWELEEDNRIKKEKILNYISTSIFDYGGFDWLSEGKKNQIKGLASFLCTIHLLGDRIEEFNTRCDLIPNMQELFNSLKDDIALMFGDHPHDVRLANDLMRSLEDSSAVPKDLLEAMEKDRIFSRYLFSLSGGDYDYRAIFSKNRFVLYEIEPVD